MHRTARFLPGDSYKASLSHVGQTSDRAPPSGPPRDGMIGMALFPGLLEREGRILAKADRLAHGASSYLQAGAAGGRPAVLRRRPPDGQPREGGLGAEG